MSRLAPLIRAAIFMALALAPPLAAERRAILIGINDYSASQLLEQHGSASSSRKAWPNLKGARHDAVALRDLLIARYGFATENIHLLLDQEATRAAILQGIDEHLIAKAQSGDQLLFFFAGHGSWVRNPYSKEADQRDETLVPADSRLGAIDLRDKELRQRFNRALDRDAHLTVILDSCHSGGTFRGLPPWPQPRSLEPDHRVIAPASPTSWPVPRIEDRGALVFAAAQDFENAWEAWDEERQISHGAFTLALLQTLRRVGPDESVELIFRQVRARLQSGRTVQEPVLGGHGDTRRTPFLGGRPAEKERLVVAVERVDGETVVLQGGWANGLSVGSELIALDNPAEERPRLRVVAQEGIVRSRAQIVEGSAELNASMPTSGDLYTLARWVLPVAQPLRVFWTQMNTSQEDEQEAFRSAEALRGEITGSGPGAGLEWIDNPLLVPPSHVLGWSDGWYLATVDDGNRVEIGDELETRQVLSRLRRLKSPVRLFVQLPVPQKLAQGLVVEKAHPAVERTSIPEQADYLLVGRFTRAGLAFTWSRPGTVLDDLSRSALPLRTNWHLWDECSPPTLAKKLNDTALRLARIHAWMRLESPPKSEFAYQLALQKHGADPSLITSGTLVAGTRLGLVLVKRPGAPAGVTQRYVYVFSLDSFGNSKLLFPRHANVGNRIPFTVPSPDRFPLGGERSLFEVAAPFGMETCFLLTSDQPLPNPWDLEQSGVRRGISPEQLLLSLESLNQNHRSQRRSSWSLERLTFYSKATR